MPIIASRGAASGKGFGMTAGAPSYMDATGGTIYDTGTYRIHLFTGPGSLIVSKVPDPAFATADYLVIGGAGGTAPSGRGTCSRRIQRICTIGWCMDLSSNGKYNWNSEPNLELKL